MRLLLDTHVFLWFITGDARLSVWLRDSIRDQQNLVHLSVVSLWEVIIKQQIGKLPLPAPADTYIPEQRQRHGISSLDLNEASVVEVSKLPLLHRDPFDRLLIAQARRHDMKLVTVDGMIRRYSVPLLDEPVPR